MCGILATQTRCSFASCAGQNCWRGLFPVSQSAKYSLPLRVSQYRAACLCQRPPVSCPRVVSSETAGHRCLTPSLRSCVIPVAAFQDDHLPAPPLRISIRHPNPEAIIWPPSRKSGQRRQYIKRSRPSPQINRCNVISENGAVAVSVSTNHSNRSDCWSVTERFLHFGIQTRPRLCG